MSTATPDVVPETALTTQNTAITPAQPTGELAPTTPDAEIIARIQQGIRNNTSQTDVRFSRLAILQPNSPEIAETQPGYQAGMIVDNVTREILSTYELPPWLVGKVKDEDLKPVHCMLMLLVYKLPKEYMKWIPRSEQQEGGDRWEFRTLDPTDPRVLDGCWKATVPGGRFKGKKPPVTDNNNFMILPIDRHLKMPNGNFRVATCAKTSSACGRQIAGILEGHAMQGITPWGRAYYLWTKRDKNEHGVFFTLEIARGPLLHEVCEPFVDKMCFGMGRALSDPETGEMFQSIVINSADFDGDDHSDSTGNSDTTISQDEADPFATVDGEAKESGF